jgi:hypothetical protein
MCASEFHNDFSLEISARPLSLDRVTSSAAANNGHPGYEIMGKAKRKISLFMRLCVCVFARRAMGGVRKKSRLRISRARLQKRLLPLSACKLCD